MAKGKLVVTTLVPEVIAVPAVTESKVVMELTVYEAQFLARMLGKICGSGKARETVNMLGEEFRRALGYRWLSDLPRIFVLMCDSDDGRPDREYSPRIKDDQ